MTLAVLDARPKPVAGRIVAEFFRREPRFAAGALCMVIAMLPTLAAMALDQRTLLGINVWIKPLKFEIALTVYLGTLAWFAGWLPQRVLAAPWYRAYSIAVVVAITAEMIWIGGAAAFGVASHFNTGSAFMIAAYALMGLFAVFLTSAAPVYGILILRDRNSMLAPAFRLSLGIGLIATFVLTVAVAGFMSTTGSHFVGGNASDVEAWPLMGWARDGGDLRIAHFFATHAMHVIPLFGYALASIRPARRGTQAVLAFGALYGAFTLYTFIEALAGKSFLTLLF